MPTINFGTEKVVKCPCCGQPYIVYINPWNEGNHSDSSVCPTCYEKAKHNSKPHKYDPPIFDKHIRATRIDTMISIGEPVKFHSNRRVMLR